MPYLPPRGRAHGCGCSSDNTSDPGSTPDFRSALSDSDRSYYTAESMDYVHRMGKRPYILIDNETVLQKFESDLTRIAANGGIYTLDCEGVPSVLSLVQLGTPDKVFLFDCLKLQHATVRSVLLPILESSRSTKLIHDVHADALGLFQHAGITLVGVLDTQLACEFLHGDLHIGLNGFLNKLRCEKRHDSKASFKQIMNEDPHYWEKRPISRDAIRYAALDAELLFQVVKPLKSTLGDNWDRLISASELCVQAVIRHGSTRRLIGFDLSNGHRLRSMPLLTTFAPESAAPSVLVDPVCEGEEDLLNILPGCFKGELLTGADSLEGIVDIALDTTSRPYGSYSDRREYLRSDPGVVVTEQHLKDIKNRLGPFGPSDRAGLNKCLHRFSAVRDRNRQLIGMTIRIGRVVQGCGCMLEDILYGMETKSVLLLGEPGCGKTTLIRDIARLLAEKKNVWIVDTSDEIAGPGSVPNPCVGRARRMVVPSLETQARVMVECVQNHTPDVMVIDEVGRPAEVNAAQTVKQRGVRMIASAHGDFRKLNRNEQTRALLGRRQETILKGGIPNVQRVSEPVFDVVVELAKGKFNECTVIVDVRDAVDKFLSRKKYSAQHRLRDPETGAISYRPISVPAYDS
eukprot:Rmarinus@m.17701